ncbi:capsular biosynthesis protein [Listeria booriae]|uniref:Capsular biosynthesis protein n=1 Tax=Listeria booriae TaxID=1552123 RepID=A0A841YJW0_9LIST|nr:Wzz/FepE/Etk N-terminal domain-containing protein [Listeria booriae]MBC1400715.1 capsular biosynthesis protein [Listeria booriae]MBC1616562.1 capsular biosynthesis protein [Listeria booriae]
MENLFSMKDIITILKKSWLWIVSFAIGGLVTASLVVYFLMTPMFAMNAQVIVSQMETSQNAVSQNAEVQANLQLVNTYRVLITSPRVLDQVSKEMDGAYTSAELAEKITVSTEQDSQVINITAQDKNADTAAEISNQAALAFQKITPKVMKVDNINILSVAQPTKATTPVSPKPGLIALVGLFGGMLLGIIIAFMRNLLSNKFKEEKDIETLGVPMLGAIGKLPEYQAKDARKGRKNK